jgi:glycosyltransferase involved in cell wall biosynthesis
MAPRRKDPVLKATARAGYRVLTGARALVFARPARPGSAPAVFYGGARSGDSGGPLVKVQRLQSAFPQVSGAFNLVYSLSNAPYLSRQALLRVKARGTRIVHNQNGVFYPGWYEGNWEAENARMSEAYHLADHVFWQSAFCRDCADRFLGLRQGPGEILFNAVDLEHFAPSRGDTNSSARPFTFLLTGKIQAHLAYRLEDTIAGIALARENGLDANLKISGQLDTGALAAATAAARRAGITENVQFSGAYTQQQAPQIYRAADAYVMTKHADPCPNTVIEAMACGLPVAYVASGGVPELVGPKAGIGVPADDNWDRPFRPDPRTLADAMLKVSAGHKEMAVAARQRAIENFDLRAWLARHASVFTEELTVS